MATWIYVDSANRIVATNPNCMAGNTHWFESDRDLPPDLMDARSVAIYKFIDGHVLNRTQEEMDADYVPQQPPAPVVSETDEALIELAAVAAENTARLDEQDMALVELAALISGGEL